jgi:DNA polymerase-3 subunit alpha
LRSAPTRSLNNKVVECLTMAGCFDRFGVTRRGLLDNIDRLTEMVAREREQQELGQGFLFTDMPSEDLEREIQGSARAEAKVRLAWEREVLGFFLTGHPLDEYGEQVQRFADCEVGDLGARFAAGAEEATVAGMVVGLRVIPIKKEGPNQGRRMAVFQLEGKGASLRAVVFPDAYDRLGRALENDRVVLVNAGLKGDGDHVELMVESVTPLDEVEVSQAAALRVVLDLDRVDEGRVEEIRELLMAHPGDMPVRFDLVRKGDFRARLVPPPALSVNASGDLRPEVEKLLEGGWTELEFEDRPKQGTQSAWVN